MDSLHDLRAILLLLQPERRNQYAIVGELPLIDVSTSRAEKGKKEAVELNDWHDGQLQLH